MCGIKLKLIRFPATQAQKIDDDNRRQVLNLPSVQTLSLQQFFLSANFFFSTAMENFANTWRILGWFPFANSEEFCVGVEALNPARGNVISRTNGRAVAPSVARVLSGLVEHHYRQFLFQILFIGQICMEFTSTTHVYDQSFSKPFPDCVIRVGINYSSQINRAQAKKIEKAFETLFTFVPSHVKHEQSENFLLINNSEHIRQGRQQMWVEKLSAFTVLQ